MNPQQYPQQPPTATPSKWGPTSMGMEAHIAAGLSYIWIVGLIFFFVEKNNRFVKFHAAQAILLGIAAFVVYVAFSILGTILAVGTSTTQSVAGATAGLGMATVLFCVSGIIYLGFFALWLWGLISGFTGKYTKMPIIGNIAESWAGGPATPAF